MEGWKSLLSYTCSPPREARVHMDAPDAPAVLSEALFQTGLPRLREADGIALLCIGTDRSIGDSLGPLIGSYLAEERCEGFSLFGTLENPVHAGNLVEAMDRVAMSFRQPLVIAVDASLGRLESIGTLTVRPGSLQPGAGVNKTLPAVGDLHLTGVVNVGGFMEYFVLQNTRLSLVMRMAKVAAKGIADGLRSLVQQHNHVS